MPLTVLYPPEVLSFDIRAVGIRIYTFTTKILWTTRYHGRIVWVGSDTLEFYVVNACAEVLMVAGLVIWWF